MSMRSYSERLYGVNVTNVKLTFETKLKTILTMINFDEKFLKDIDCYDDAMCIAMQISAGKDLNEKEMELVESVFKAIDECYEGNSCEASFWFFLADYITHESAVCIIYSNSNLDYDYHSVVGIPSGFPWSFDINEKNLDAKDVEELLKKFFIDFKIDMDYDDAFWCYYEEVEFFG